MLCVRMSVSVPGELSEEMKKVRHVNWSKIAQDAFRDYLSGKGLSPLAKLSEENAQLKRKLATAEKRIQDVLDFLAQ